VCLTPCRAGPRERLQGPPRLLLAERAAFLSADARQRGKCRGPASRLAQTAPAMDARVYPARTHRRTRQDGQKGIKDGRERVGGRSRLLEAPEGLERPLGGAGRRGPTGRGSVGREGERGQGGGAWAGRGSVGKIKTSREAPRSPWEINGLEPGKPKFYRQTSPTPLLASVYNPAQRRCWLGGLRRHGGHGGGAGGHTRRLSPGEHRGACPAKTCATSAGSEPRVRCGLGVVKTSR
jgi:hypothetical protein